MAEHFDELALEAQFLGKATLHPEITGTPHVFGSGAFFSSATDLLVASTRDKCELGGACYCVKKDNALVLVGLKRFSRGDAKHVAVDPDWGAVLWHTHPGLSFSIAAFSGGDIEGARLTDRPLLVIGYRSASPDVLGITQALSMVQQTEAAILDRLLRIGVAARVCWPNGEVRAVRRYQASGLREVVDDATFQIDRAVGVAARQLERPGLLELSHKIVDAVDNVREKARARFGNKKR